MPTAEAIEETTEAVIEEPIMEAIEETAEKVADETIVEVVEETAETIVEESIAETVEETTEAVAEVPIAEAIEETTEAVIEEPIMEAVEETAEKVADETIVEVVEETTETIVEESITEAVEGNTEAVAEVSTAEAIEETTVVVAEEPTSESAVESAEAGAQEFSDEKGGETEKTIAVEAESVLPKQIIRESPEKPEEDAEDIYIPTIGSLSIESGGSDDSIVARALANIKAANGEGPTEAYGGSGNIADKNVDIVEQAVARVTYDSDLENIFSEAVSDKSAENEQTEDMRIDQGKENSERENKPKAPGGKIDDDYLAYLESAFIDDNDDVDEFFDGERTEGI